MFEKKKKENAACAFVLLWRGRPRKRNFQADEVQIEEKTQARSFCFLFLFFFKFFCQEIRNTKIFILLWNKSKNFYSDTRPCEGETVTQKTAYVWGANLAQALYNVKIAKTKYIFKAVTVKMLIRGKEIILKNGKYCLVYI